MSKINKKRLLVVLSVIVFAFVLTGCTVPMDENGNVLLIHLTDTFKSFTSSGKEDIFGVIITYPLAQAINWLAQYMNIGLAITVVTLVLNAIIVAATFKSNVAMQRMQELQPELTRLQQKYEGRNDTASQQRMSMEMQNLYKKYDVNPLGTLLVTFIQFPILIGMYNAVRRSAAVYNGTFFGVQLIQLPRAAFQSLFGVEAFEGNPVVGIVIYVLMILLQFLSIKVPSLLAERRAKKEAEKRHKPYVKPQQQNILMTYGMLIFIAIIMLNWPLALSLYYCIYSLVNIVKAFAIDHLTHKNEA